MLIGSAAVTEELDSLWKLNSEEAGAVMLLCDALRRIAGRASNGEQLIRIGEAWDALQCVLDGKDVAVDLQVSVGFRRGDEKNEGGLFMCLRVNNEEIVLDELNTQWSSAIGSDNFTNVYCRIYPCGECDTTGIYSWLEKFDEVIQADDAEITVARDHV